MNKFKATLTGLAIVLLMSACNSKDDIVYGSAESSGVGRMSLSMNAQKTAFKSAQNASNTIDVSVFKVQILDAESNVVRSFNKYSDMPAEFELKAGSYTIKAISSELQEAAFDAPHYAGEKIFAIAKDQTTAVEMTCTLENMAVSIGYTELFKTAVKDYTVTVSNGTGNLLFDEEGKIGYFKVAPLTIVLNGKAILDDSPITFTHTISSVFPKDFHKVTFDITSDGAGILQKPGIVVDESLNDKNTTITIPGNGGSASSSKPTVAGVDFNIDTPISFVEGDEANYPTVKIDLQAKEKIRSLVVKIESAILEPALNLFGIPVEFDMANLDADLKSNFEAISLIKEGDVIKGAESYTFDISSFMGLLEAGEHKFHITLTDEKLNATSKTLVVTPTSAPSVK